MRYARPRFLRGRSEDFEDLVQLVVRVPDTGERWHARDHFHENAPDTPHVERG